MKNRKFLPKFQILNALANFSRKFNEESTIFKQKFLNAISEVFLFSFFTPLRLNAGGAEHRPPGSYLAGGARRHVAYAEGVRGGDDVL